MKDPIPISAQIMDSICSPRGKNHPCPLLEFDGETFCCTRNSSKIEEVNERRVEDTLPPLHGHCSGVPLYIKNIDQNPDAFPTMHVNIMIGGKTLRAIMPYSQWDDFKIQAKQFGQNVYSFVMNLIIDSLKKRTDK